MRKGVKITLWTILPVAAIIVCAVRWQAWFGMPAEPQWTGDTLSGRFITFADESVPGFIHTPNGWKDTRHSKTLDILVLGDIHSSLKRADYDLLATRLPEAEVVAQVGDWMDRGQEYYRQLLLREWNDCGLSNLPVINCPGNHEYTKGIHKALSPVWQETFPQLVDSSLEVPGVNYYVDFPNLRFIVIDSNPLDRVVYLTRVLTWLREAMYTADNRFVVVMLHHPVVPVGKGRLSPLIYATFYRALGEADLVLTGHDHSYARQMPFVTCNSAGKPKQQRASLHFDSSSMEPTYIHLAVSKQNLVMRVYRMSDGSLIDNVNVKHN